MDIDIPAEVCAIAEASDLEREAHRLLAYLEQRLAGDGTVVVPTLSSPSLSRILDLARSQLLPSRDAFATIETELRAMSDCDFTRAAATSEGAQGGAARETLDRLSSNLRVAMQQMLDFSGAIGEQAGVLAGKNGELIDRTQGEAAALEQAAAAVEQLASSARDNESAAQHAVGQAAKSCRAATEGLGFVDRMAESMRDVQRQMAGVEAITAKINAITFQTNILALNAAVEASRAGESGRSFAVVATEIRDLSTRCAEASKEISQILASAHQQVEVADRHSADVVAAIKRTVEESESGVESIQQMTRHVTEQKQAIEEIHRQIFSIDAATQENLQLTGFLGQSIRQLHDCATFMADAVKVFRLPCAADSLHGRHRLAVELARRAAGEAGTLFDRAIASGRIDEADLFDRRYRVIPGTEPKKYHTGFDRLADQLLPPLQEAILDAHPFVVFAACADANGYIPTHNRKFSQPLTGNREVDLANNRTKRVFRDRVGRVSGANQEPWKLQIYRRDTGELMFDMSAPVYVRGRHWGCIRLGYRV
ncbi:MAG TPA: methyl-accepting chemotaxis protein [Rhodocyclaceae bacterium]|nr:hypothetical protein [Rhodocyclaceae bacterium]MBP8296186.1 methyl-accepting chemotaxis protein [Burkholderiales bacterium]HMV54312.1 methyl-accepting chemotaxis protein [Rhodocyclaceae bacterium]HNA04467.1 methyl-accepting chemotaxis protein [Rhodocyclaceae bacterium]HNB77674.1 methyl-accepting chemotaxis protein [Rhodocyclaceae bacterium]